MARVVLAFAAILSALPPASAQTAPAATLPAVVPLPPLPPLPKEGAHPTTPAAGIPQVITPAPSTSAGPGAGVPAPAAAPGTRSATFDVAQRSTVERINVYFNSINALVGNFVQVGPDGSRSAGEIYLQKPGKVRFEYDPPSPIELIADGDTVAVRDRKLATQDIYPLSQTPLRFLLSAKLDLLKDTNVVGVYQDDIFITVVIEEKHVIVGTHRLMIMFGAQDSQLKQWTVTDPQGLDTTVAVYNLDLTHKPDPRLFKITYERAIQ